MVVGASRRQRGASWRTRIPHTRPCHRRDAVTRGIPLATASIGRDATRPGTKASEVAAVIGTVYLPPRRQPTLDEMFRADLARERGLADLNRSAPMDVLIRSSAAKLRNHPYVPPRRYLVGARPRRGGLPYG